MSDFVRCLSDIYHLKHAYLSYEQFHTTYERLHYRYERFEFLAQKNKRRKPNTYVALHSFIFPPVLLPKLYLKLEQMHPPVVLRKRHIYC